MKYYTIQNDSLLIAENKQALERYYENILPLPSDYEQDKYIVVNGELVLNPDWEEEKKRRERERLDALSMTRSDFFDGMIMAFGLDSKELRIVIENILNSINITPVEIKVALNNYDNALNFYRKHTLFTLLNNVPIEIGEYTLIFTSDIWDKFFDETNKRNPKAYEELQKAIQVEPEPEPVDDDSDSDTDTDSEVVNE